MTDLQGVSLKCEFPFMSFTFVHNFIKSRFQFQFLLWERTLHNKQTKTYPTLLKAANFWLSGKRLSHPFRSDNLYIQYSLSQPTINKPQEVRYTRLTYSLTNLASILTAKMLKHQWCRFNHWKFAIKVRTPMKLSAVGNCHFAIMK